VLFRSLVLSFATLALSAQMYAQSASEKAVAARAMDALSQLVSTFDANRLEKREQILARLEAEVARISASPGEAFFSTRIVQLRTPHTPANDTELQASRENIRNVIQMLAVVSGQAFVVMSFPERDRSGFIAVAYRAKGVDESEDTTFKATWIK